ncbi:helix-turn-helix domain-containing protein [Aerococcus urinaeequi]|uniref:helix-turn-helix domain-containing protein n=1 Tax=Aerococcus urinaeequi TaxID=51665 RepID=UPI003D6AB1AD
MSLQLSIPPEFYTALQNELKDVYVATMEEAKRDFGYMKEYLTIKEACEYVSVSNNTFSTHYIGNGLSIYKIGNKQYVKKSELNNFISQHRIN